MKKGLQATSYKLQASKGFTLIEILLVIAIIGILAAAVFAMIGNSDNSKRKATLSTTRSILTYAQECYFNQKTLNTDVDGTDGAATGDIICDGSITEWPELSVDGCTYNVPSNSYNYSVECGGGIGNIDCDAQTGSCVENY